MSPFPSIRFSFPPPTHCSLISFLCSSNSPSMAGTLIPSSNKLVQHTEETLTQPPPKTLDFPIPLTRHPPPISKQVELDRAMAASAKSAFSITKSDVIYEDQWLIAINKPSGVYCDHVLASIPRLLGVSPESSGAENPLELHLGNRLDRDTSGVMLITKLHKVAGKLVQAFTEHRVKKTYIALCIGLAPQWEEIALKSGHGRSKFGAWRVYSASDIGRTLPGGSVVREMVTSFKVLSVNGLSSENIDFIEKRNEMLIVRDEGSKISSTHDAKDEILIRAYPQSGRTHQIRLHCQYLGIPLRGDVKYEGPHEWKEKTYDYHALHAENLSFDHPVTGSLMEFHAPLPSWAREALSCTKG
ncbi:hypothetical protein AMTRI_Chr02g221210 [Amborella trichopoda]